MSNINNPVFLREQYKDAGNLTKRANLHALFSVNPLSTWRWAFDHYAMPPHARILELGCGFGSEWPENAERIPSGWDITLTDFSSGMVEQACANLAAIAHPFSFKVMDAQDITFCDATFDAVIAHFMLYHVPDRAKAFREVRRALKTGGAFYAITIGENHLRELFALRAQFFPGGGFWGGDPASAQSAAMKVFSLQNGAAQLSPFFSSVALHLHEDALRVTDADALVEHALSTSPSVAPEQRGAFRKFVQHEMDKNGGVLHITKETGMFVCKP